MVSLAAFKSIKVFDHDYAYLDSGAPPASTNYTTWVILHGLGFNGAVFEKLLPLAHAHNLRIVSVNRRGYPPSSGFREDELNTVGGFGQKFDAGPLFRALGVEIATFLVKFATEQGIPFADPSSPTGGIVLVGWSLASIHVAACLAYVDELPEDDQFTLRKYLHTILTHDASTPLFGMPTPEQYDLSLWAHTDDHQCFDAFFHWVTGHYTHRSVTSGNVDDLEFNHPTDIPHSFNELTYEQRADYMHFKAFILAGCDGRLRFGNMDSFVPLAKRAFFDKARAEAFPNVRVRYLSSGASPGILIWTLWTLQKHVENPELFYGTGAEKARDIKIINHTDGNHFIFWEDPERAIEQYSAAINL